MQFCISDMIKKFCIKIISAMLIMKVSFSVILAEIQIIIFVGFTGFNPLGLLRNFVRSHAVCSDSR